MLRKLTLSNGLITFLALFTAVGPYLLADFNSSHIYNQAWPGHARFHSGQTMTTGLLRAALALLPVGQANLHRPGRAEGSVLICRFLLAGDGASNSLSGSHA